MKHQGLHFLVGGPQASLPLGVLGLLCKGVVGKAKKGGRQSVPPAHTGEPRETRWKALS